MTVVRVLREPHKVAVATRERVEKVLADTGYTPDLVARGLVSNKSGLVGAVVPLLTNSLIAEIVQGLSEIEPKTKAMKTIIEKLPESRSVLIVIPEKSEVVDRAASNLPNVRTILASYVNVRDVLKYERLVVTPEAIAKIEELWALPEEKRTPSAFKQARLAAASAGAEKGA